MIDEPLSVDRLLAEQTALRRVAELVAREAHVALDEVLAAVVRETAALVGVEVATVIRYEPDGSNVLLAVHSDAPGIEVGMRAPAGGDSASAQVLRTGRSARVERLRQSNGRWPRLADEVGLTSSAAAPIFIEGRVWGAMIAATSRGSLGAEAERHLASFAELAASAISGAQARADLRASRARVVATADETRRRIQRDLHDGAQQRFAQTIITLKLAQDALRAGELEELDELLAEALQYAEHGSTDLRDLVRGILPAALTKRGLPGGIAALVRDVALPVEADADVPRVAVEVETTAYFIVAEALANVVKHAGASRVWVAARVVDGAALALEVRDDGRGGADEAGGSGLTGLRDRVDAHDGRLELVSPPGAGTALRVTLPLP